MLLLTIWQLEQIVAQGSLKKKKKMFGMFVLLVKR